MNKTLTEIYNKYKNYNGGDKGTSHSYIDIYENLLTPLRNNNISLLEIGVYRGHSMMLWKEFFINGKIFGIDINKNRLEFKDDGFIVVEGDATKEQDINNFFHDMTFDIIIDDGSHKLKDQIASYNILYNKLNPNGLYFIEDIQNFKYCDQFLQLNPKTYIFDLRKNKNRNDDILIKIEK